MCVCEKDSLDLRFKASTLLQILTSCTPFPPHKESTFMVFHLKVSSFHTTRLPFFTAGFWRSGRRKKMMKHIPHSYVTSARHNCSLCFLLRGLPSSNSSQSSSTHMMNECKTKPSEYGYNELCSKKDKCKEILIFFSFCWWLALK